MAEQKYQDAQAFNLRLPCVFATNDSLEDFAENRVHFEALKNRTHILEMRVPVLEKEPNAEQLAALHNGKYLIRPRVTIDGLAVMGLYGRYWPNGVDSYDNEVFQKKASQTHVIDGVRIKLKNPEF